MNDWLLLVAVSDAEGWVASLASLGRQALACSTADQASEQRRAFDLRDMIQDLLGSLAPSLQRKPHRIVLDVPSGRVVTHVTTEDGIVTHVGFENVGSYVIGRDVPVRTSAEGTNQPCTTHRVLGAYRGVLR